MLFICDHHSRGVCKSHPVNQTEKKGEIKIHLHQVVRSVSHEDIIKSRDDNGKRD